MRVIIPTRDNILQSHVGYHVGARYLTGADRIAYDDKHMEEYLGRLSSFILEIFPRSTLAKSPHMHADKSASYPDGDTTWTNFLRNFKIQSSVATQNMINTAGTDLKVATDDQINALRAGFQRRDAQQQQ